MQPLAVVVLAAGQGKRMRSELPKVLHPIGGRAMLGHVLETARQLAAQQRIVVFGHGGEAVRAAFADQPDLLWAEQHERLGTGHAVAQSFPQLIDTGVALILYGDVPLIPLRSLRSLVDAAAAGLLGLLTVELANPTGYGRIVRADNGSGEIVCIIEEQDASPEQKQIREANTGILAAPVAKLRDWLSRVSNDNAQGEYYLTDIIALAVSDGVAVAATRADDPYDVQGVNDRIQLAALERCYQRRQADKLMLAGATLSDPARLDVRGEVSVGQDVTIDVNVVFEGQVVLGDRVKVGPNCVIKDSVIEADSEVLSHSSLEQARLGQRVTVGPFARLRPGTRLAEGVKIGNFVETKNAVLGAGSKANHLSYLGDSELGSNVNIGAGTITCNYDGANKHKTVIEDDVFIGSNNSLVAPIHVGKGATTGAGSTLSNNVSGNALTVARGQRRELKDWARPVKKPKN